MHHQILRERVSSVKLMESIPTLPTILSEGEKRPLTKRQQTYRVQKIILTNLTSSLFIISYHFSVPYLLSNELPRHKRMGYQ